LLNVLYEIEWFGLCLFVPAIVSGALAAEKERNTLQLLFLTRLGPWTILLEKLLSRFVPVATFLLVSLPLLFIAYLMGGLTRSDLQFAAIGLAATAFQVGCIALFCSAFCATSASAFVMSYVLIALVLLFPFFAVLAIISFESCYQLVAGSNFAVIAWLNDPQTHATIERVVSATLGINLDWLFGQMSAPGPVRPFHTTSFPLIVIASIGLIFLILARLVIVRRASPQPKNRIRRFFQWLDRVFGRLNDRYARGIVLSRPGSDLPGDNPVAWREKRRGTLGRINYLVRMLLVIELPILLFTVMLVVNTPDVNFTGLSILGLLLWPIALLVVFVRSAGLIAAEKARQTLDVLLTTPLPLSALAGAKMRGLWRVMFIVSVPILLHALFVGYLQTSTTGRRTWHYSHNGFGLGIDANISTHLYVVIVAVNLVILLGLAAQLAFLFGLRAKTQGRAVTAVLGVFIAWCFIPLIVRVFAETGSATLYFSPIGSLLVNEYPDLIVDRGIRLGTETGTLRFELLLHCGIYAALVVALARVNRRLAARALLRSVTGRSHSRPPIAVTRYADPSTAI
jgi:hypothetical protein